MKIKTFKSGAYIIQETTFPSGMGIVTLKSASGEVLDRVKCDTKTMAREYFKAFSKIAKGTK